MKVLIIFNHPNGNSLCGSILKSLITGLESAGTEYEVIDLDNDNFNPVMNKEELAVYYKGIVLDPKVLEYQEKIKSAEHLVFIFPVWWELMPALMKGFLDKVLTKYFAFDTYPKKKLPVLKQLLFNIKSVTLITTMNTPLLLYRYYFGNAVIRSFFRGTFKKLGVKKLKWFNLTGVKYSKPDTRAKWLKKVEKYGSLLSCSMPSNAATRVEQQS